MGEAPIVQQLLSKSHKSSGNVGNVGFPPTCFKCGTAAHFSQDCKNKFSPCTYESCTSSSHSSAGHQAMLNAGRTVSPDKAKVAAVGGPATPAATPKGNQTPPLTDAQLVAQAKK